MIGDMGDEPFGQIIGISITASQASLRAKRMALKSALIGPMPGC